MSEKKMVESEYRSALARLDDLRADPEIETDPCKRQMAELLTYRVRFYEAAHMGAARPDEAGYLELLKRIAGHGARGSDHE